MSEYFNPTPSEDYATLRRQFGALVRIVRGKEAQSLVNHEKMTELRNEASLSNKEAIEAMRATNEKLTNINESIESHNRDLLAVIAAKDNLIRQCIDNNLNLADGDDCTLKMIKDALAINTTDVTLAEVAEVAPSNNGSGLISAKYNSSPACGKLMFGDKLYVLQIKSNA